MDVEFTLVGSGCGRNFNHPWLLQNSNNVNVQKSWSWNSGRTNEKNVIRENVSVNIEEKMFQVRVNEFASWVPSFNNIEEYESNDEESSKNGDGDSAETQSNEGSFGHMVQESSNELNKEATSGGRKEKRGGKQLIPL
ncbi:hypothetical protein L1987_44112 [Smallanthus sonchifolius]|uniref:Uncharacterized protein n=1 Tax=Smallanthus sonchifolius TaxID=185202 RepID=A0ACB9GMY9_9ASTR|nr:hypothetical protein L1987_44112 [Smallanthus sonchifolius]